MNRDAMLERLRGEEIFDLLVIGGGATGCGIALDAASRGLRAALIEKNDFAEGTSSRSTKLVHGGVRYLEMAVRHLDRAQYRLVHEGLKERAILLRNAPHLVRRLPLVTPLYRRRDVPYIYAGLKLYDLLAGRRGIGHSRLVGRRTALERFPMLRAEGLKAGVLYYDGQFNDARTAVALTRTAWQKGAVTANHVEAMALVKKAGRICGAVARDALTGEEFTLRARGVINATGPFADRLRLLDDPAAAPILEASSGVHIVLGPRFAPPGAGLMIPSTEDGRILFVLPWQGHALIGTTDEPAEIEDHPRPKEEDISYLLRHVRRYFDLQVTRADVKAAWSGLRPLVSDPGAGDTAHLVREHVLQLSPAGLLTVAGGKWTSYRRMAEEAVDRAVGAFALAPARSCHTDRLPLSGAAHYRPDGGAGLVREFGLAEDIAGHLHRAYGDEAPRLAELARKGAGERLHPDHPFIEAEVAWGVRQEMAARAADVLVRRTTLALLDTAAAEAAAPRVIELMARELGWGEAQCREEADRVRERLSVGI